MERLQHLSWENLKEVFPHHQYPEMRKNQKEALEIIAKINSSVILELPTGSGKTAIGYTFLKALEKRGHKSLFYIAPTKTIINQIRDLHPDVKIIYGRNEYQCIWYNRQMVTAEEAPCSLLDCPHRVNQDTGDTEIGGVYPCPYLQAKYEAKQGGIIACTMSFYLFTHLFSKEWGEIEGLVIDEAHRIASIVRNSLSYEITDYYLGKVIELLEEINVDEAQILKNFEKKMKRIISQRPPRTAVLLETAEIIDLLRDLYEINPKELQKSIKSAIKRGAIDSQERREILKKTEIMTRSLVRYLKSLEYSLPNRERQPLNYTYGYYEEERGDNNKKAQYRLTIRAYYVAPLIRRLLSPMTVAYSATIGDYQVFGWESGIEFPFYSLVSDFPVKNTKIFLPTDTPNLAMKSRNRQDMTRTLRKIAKTCKLFAEKGKRSLVVVISDAERQKFLMLAKEENLNAISYGNGVKPRIAAEQFKAGEGETLVGTAANYGEGIDLPAGIAPVIFFLRPGYARPNDPAAIFEERRYGSNSSWKLKNWRVAIEALQVRGRNVRSAEDIGITFFVSQQFRRFLFANLPEWLKAAYYGDKKWDECIKCS